MNAHEERAWRQLERMGAKRIELGGFPALDLRPIRIRSARALADFTSAFHEVAGRSGSVRRHEDRRRCPVFVVSNSTPPRSDR